MNKFIKYLPLLLVGVTVSTDGNISFSSGDYSIVGDKMINLGSSFLQITIGYLPYLIVFGVVVGFGLFVFNKLTHHK